MKKKTLNEEINRILVLMEAPNKWVTLGKRLVGVLEQLPDLSTPAKKLFGELANAADDETAIKILIDLANTEKRFFDQIFPIFKKHMNNADQINLEMEEIVINAKELLDDGATEAQVIKTIDDRLDADYIKWQSQEIKQLFRKDILDEISSYSPKKTVTPPPVPPGATVQEVESLTDLVKRVNTLNPGLISPKDAALLYKNFPFRESRAKINRFLNEHLLKGRDLEEKIAKLLKRAADELSSAREVDPIIYKTLSAEMEALRESDNVLMDLVYQDLEKALAVGLGNTAEAQRDASIIIQKIKEHDALNPNAPTYLDDLLANTYVGKIAEWRKVSFFTNLINAFWRSVSFTLTGQLRTLSEFVAEFLMTKKSIPGKVWKVWWYFTAMTKIFVPAVLGIFQTFWNGIKMSTPLEEKEGALWEQYKAVMAEKLKESFIAFDEEVKKETEKIINPLDPNENVDELYTLLKTLNPFEYYGDEVLDAMNSIAGGFTSEKIEQSIKSFINRFRDDVEQRTGVVVDTAEETIDSLTNTIENAGQSLDPLVVDTTGNTQIKRRTPSPGSGN